MGLCDPCKEDDHSRHKGRYEVTVHRKGLKVKNRSVECTCEKCTTDGTWRGEPTAVPKWCGEG